MKKVEKLKKEIFKVKTELIMEGYLDGWTKKWYQNRLKQLLIKLKTIIN